jgi:hypothetical protein
LIEIGLLVLEKKIFNFFNEFLLQHSGGKFFPFFFESSTKIIYSGVFRLLGRTPLGKNSGSARVIDPGNFHRGWGCT